MNGKIILESLMPEEVAKGYGNILNLSTMDLVKPSFSFVTLMKDWEFLIGEEEDIEDEDIFKPIRKEYLSSLEYGISSVRMPNYSFYSNGILFSKSNIPIYFLNKNKNKNNGSSFQFPILIRANLKQSINSKVNVSRTNLEIDQNNWDESLFKKYSEYIIKNKRDEYNNMRSDFERLKLLAKLNFDYRISIEILWQNLKVDNWPVLLLDNGVLKTLKISEINFEETTIVYNQNDQINYLREIFEKKIENNPYFVKDDLEDSVEDNIEYKFENQYRLYSTNLQGKYLFSADLFNKGGLGSNLSIPLYLKHCFILSYYGYKNIRPSK